MEIRPTAVVAALALALIGLPAAASAQRVDVEAKTDKSASFKGLKTYRWLPPPPAPPATIAPDAVQPDRRTIEQIDPVIHNAVDRELGAKGYRKVESGDSDLLVGYLINLATDFNSFTMADEYAALTGTTVYFSFGRASRTSSLTYAETGTLAMGVVSAKTRQAMWRGEAKTKVTLDTPRSQVDRAIDEGVRRLFRKFPKQSDK